MMYSVSQVADIFNVSRQTILLWINKGVLKASKPVRKYCISKEEVERLKNNVKQSGSD